MAYNKKSLENLRRGGISSEKAREMQPKAIEVREARRRLESQVSQLIDLLTAAKTDEEFNEMVAQLPTPFLRIYGNDLKDPKQARSILESILDRSLGKARQQTETKVDISASEGFRLVVSDDAAKSLK